MRILWAILGIGILAGTAFGMHWYGDYRDHFPKTNDAYVRANVISVAAQVPGEAVEVAVDDHALVKAGQLLAQLDDQPFRIQLAQAENKIIQARQSIDAGEAGIAAAQAEIALRRAQLHMAELQSKRVFNLSAQNSVPKSAADSAQEGLSSARAGLAAAEAHLRQATIMRGSPGEDNERLKEAKLFLEKAQLDLTHTHLEAPCNGRIANLSLRPGELVQPGRPLFSIVCSDEYWVYANFKETELVRIRPGQTAEIRVDMYPGEVFHGVVQNIGPGSGTAFSMLPPQNATGNWVKVTQRVPVRIRITDPRENVPLRVETSAEVTVDTGKDEKPSGYAHDYTGQIAPTLPAQQDTAAAPRTAQFTP
jgi:membrane fusion protein (multidrug efflux system)